ncbi:hypothetical protein MCOR02_001116 [Pyricularia oryzae]|nr:hypothetical protein MCOR02_001116 [Pyricularia oryzae]
MAQNQMNYLAPNGTVRGYNFRLIWPMGLPDGIMQTSYSASTQSSLSSLWPLQHYQDSDGAIFEVTQVNDRAKLTDVPNADKGTPLLALPVAAKHASKEVRLFYRNTDGNLALYERDSTGKATDATASLGIPIPADAKLAGFANARAATGPASTRLCCGRTGRGPGTMAASGSSRRRTAARTGRALLQIPSSRTQTCPPTSPASTRAWAAVTFRASSASRSPRAAT